MPIVFDPSGPAVASAPRDRERHGDPRAAEVKLCQASPAICVR